jgi:hypothetical protein
MRKRMSCLLIAVFVSMTSSAVSGEVKPMSGVAWLQGCWAVEGAEAGSGEQWSAPAGGAMIGAGRTVRGGKMIEHEYMQLREIGGKLTYVVLMPGQPEVGFTLRPGRGCPGFCVNGFSFSSATSGLQIEW